MPNFADMRPSRFMKSEHVRGRPLIVTISEYTLENVAPENQKPDEKWVVHFSDYDKPLVLNNTNMTLIAENFGVEDTDETVGKQIELYFDPNVMFGNERKGGIRVRLPSDEGVAPASVV